MLLLYGVLWPYCSALGVSFDESGSFEVAELAAVSVEETGSSDLAELASPEKQVSS